MVQSERQSLQTNRLRPLVTLAGTLSFPVPQSRMQLLVLWNMDIIGTARIAGGGNKEDLATGRSS